MIPDETTVWESHIGGRIHFLSNHLRRIAANREGFRRLESVTGNNGRIIVYLSRHQDGDIFQRDIERAFGVTRSTASKVLALMEKKGLIQRRGVPEDARLKRITLTERSRELSRQMCAESDAMDRQLLLGFAPEEERALRSFLDRMLNNLENLEA